MAKRFKPCSVDDCKRNSHSDDHGAVGLCSKHYQMKRIHGDPNYSSRAKEGSLRQFVDDAVKFAGSECLLWPFKSKSNGYGSLKVDGKSMQAHRYVCEKAHGPCPSEGHHAAHFCGVRGCINPRHLRWATIAENHADKKLHGTSNEGEAHPHAKLTERDVKYIRRNTSEETYKQLSKRFDVHVQTIYSIRKGKLWGHIA